MKVQMQKDIIIQKLKDEGLRITKQRRMLLDIILEENCACCKEIYYKAVKKDPKIGAATVYRMVNTLENIGAISRRNMYRIVCNEDCDQYEIVNGQDNECIVEFDDDTVYNLSPQNWNQVIITGLKACGYMVENQKMKSIRLSQCTG